jgi:hypothetical protein
MDIALRDFSGVEVTDKYSILQDVHCIEVRRMQREIAEHCMELTPRDVDICKQYHAGKPIKEIAESHELAESSVHRIVAKSPSQKLLSLLFLMQSVVDGPNKEQRQACLWRIVVDNEKRSPRTAIKAIETLNEMVDGKGRGGGAALTVIVNNAVLTSGPLD